MKVAIYCRVSTDDKGQDPKSQLEKCRDYCRLHNHSIIGEFLEEGVTGDSFYYDRPEGKKLQELIDRNKIEGIVCFSLDRFSRQNPMKILPLLNTLKDRGVTFVSSTEPIFNLEGNFSEPMRYMLSWFSNYFLIQHKIKVRSGLDKAKKYGTRSGKAIGRERKADYNKILELHNKGISISQIARDLKYSKSSVWCAIDSSKRSLSEHINKKESS